MRGVAAKEGILYVRYMFLLLYCVVCKIEKLLKLEYKINAFQVIRYSVLEKLNVFVGTQDPPVRWKTV